MSTMLRKLPLMLVFGAAVTLASPVFAQGWGDPRGGYGYQSEAQFQAYDHGYRKGMSNGREDAEDHRSYDYRRDKDYRKADDGYKSRYGSREWYSNEFRRGYVVGYERGYNEYYGRYNNRYRNDRYRNDGYYRNNGPYVSGGYDGRAYPRASVSVGFNRGHNDGLTKGTEDVRHNRSYDPNRHAWYRSADRGYDGDEGSRYAYQSSYRQGFEQGYAEGYRGRY